MKKISILFMVFLLGGCSIPFLGGKKSGLKIATTPGASVILDGKQMGQTPFDQSGLQAKTYKVQLVPQSGQPWEGSVTLHDNLQTVVERIFGKSDQESEGYVMELEAIGNKSDSQISVVTIPDPATVRIDGQPKGFAPLNTTLGTEGAHEVAISSAGYNEKKVSVTVPKGYELHLMVQLSRTSFPEPTPAVEGAEATPSATPTSKTVSLTPTPKVSSLSPTPTPKKTTAVTPTPPARPYAEILSTGTKATTDAPNDNWLRVRSTGSQSGELVAYVYAGETYKFLESNEVGWYHIQLSTTKDGWISSQYAKLYK